jgi:Na+-transporting NADH:ubiquinone oxidoreductase subunit NqrE
MFIATIASIVQLVEMIVEKYTTTLLPVPWGYSCR